MIKDKPPKSPATNSLVKTVAWALIVNVKRFERLHEKTGTFSGFRFTYGPFELGGRDRYKSHRRL